jgi:hypothetical protein
MPNMMKVSFLDMLLPRNHTDDTILGYIRSLRVHMSRWMIQKQLVSYLEIDENQWADPRVVLRYNDIL